MGSAATVQRQLVDTKLGGNLDGLVIGLRLNNWGWRKIATEVTKRSGVTVSHETLRNWYPAEPTPEAAVPA